MSWARFQKAIFSGGREGDLHTWPHPGARGPIAYKVESPAVELILTTAGPSNQPGRTMAVFRSLLPQLGLLLCLALGFSPAFSASYNVSCMVFDIISNSTSDNLGIRTQMEVSGRNITWTGESKSFILLSFVLAEHSLPSSLPTCVCEQDGKWGGAVKLQGPLLLTYFFQ